MPGERVGAGGAAADEREQQEVADVRGGRDGEYQGDQCRAVSLSHECGRDHEAAAWQKGQQRVTGHGEKSDGEDEPGLDRQRAHLDLHGSIVSNVQIVVNT
ncbi:hypothetical protein [Streptomyces sp. bgisy027]|uniref:hypothetical protein n=1 Tax=unclassified Streptomyces TaxID=2593676 RepID=UPI003D7512FF